MVPVIICSVRQLIVVRRKITETRVIEAEIHHAVVDVDLMRSHKIAASSAFDSTRVNSAAQRPDGINARGSVFVMESAVPVCGPFHDLLRYTRYTIRAIGDLIHRIMARVSPGAQGYIRTAGMGKSPLLGTAGTAPIQ